MLTFITATARDPRTGEECPVEWYNVDTVGNYVEYFIALFPPVIPGTRPEFILHLNLN